MASPGLYGSGGGPGDGQAMGGHSGGRPGAGGPETSSAILADILAIARGEGSTWAGLPPAGQG